jgi:hypothetical protein
MGTLHKTLCEKFGQWLMSRWKLNHGLKVIKFQSRSFVLNHYKHLTNQIDSPNCSCGESETVHHYLLQCPNYEEEREGFRTGLYFATGSLNLDLDTLLSFGKDDQYNSTRDTILQLLGEFINKTKRFQLCSSFNHL